MDTPVVIEHATGGSLVVSEAFGPTIQGEGPSAGRRAFFIRLGGCNLHCVWCDSKYTWDADHYDLRMELNRRLVSGLLDEVDAAMVPLVVITGGEPLLHQGQQGWRLLLGGLAARDLAIEVETNGTQEPRAASLTHVTRFNVSPKLAHAGDPAGRRIVPEALTALLMTGCAVFKFVCRDLDDLAEAAGIARRAGIPPRLVWIMPEGTTPEVLTGRLRDLADATVTRGFNLTGRLHVQAWGEERGR